MTPADREALEALNSRLDHTAAIARLVSQAASDSGDVDFSEAVRGIAETLSEQAGRMDRILNPGTR